jgi:hypothetical protein
MAQRTDERREADLVREAELYLKGWSQYQIAADRDISQGTVSNDLKEVHKRWRAAMVETYDELQRRELARVDQLESTYWGEWEKSQEPKTTEGGKITTRPDGDKTEEGSKKIEERIGDPRYLEGVRWCIDKRCKILGLDAPIRTQSTEVVGVLNLTDDDLDDPEIAARVATLTHMASVKHDEMAKPGGNEE